MPTAQIQVKFLLIVLNDITDLLVDGNDNNIDFCQLFIT